MFPVPRNRQIFTHYFLFCFASALSVAGRIVWKLLQQVSYKHRQLAKLCISLLVKMGMAIAIKWSFLGIFQLNLTKYERSGKVPFNRQTILEILREIAINVPFCHPASLNHLPLKFSPTDQGKPPSIGKPNFSSNFFQHNFFQSWKVYIGRVLLKLL